ncbi:MAG: O-glycosyl hydrolase [Acidobacteriaceae bacterium]|nr:O-glycosyl hydrolase [Acidobacteriaceae bacterium]
MRYEHIISRLRSALSLILLTLVFSTLYSASEASAQSAAALPGPPAQTPNDSLVVNDIVPVGSCFALVPCTFRMHDFKTNFDGTSLTSADTAQLEPRPWCFPTFCNIQYDYARLPQSDGAYSLGSPGVGTIGNGITIGLRILVNQRNDDNQRGTIIAMPGVFEIETIGPRWGTFVHQDNGYELTPWEPYDYPGYFDVFEDIYYTFTKDGRVRIDKFTPYHFPNDFSKTSYIWEESINDSGWPFSFAGSTQQFVHAGPMYWGSTHVGSQSAVDALSELLIFKQALTNDQMIDQENFYHPSNGQLADSMSPCNTGNWINSGIVQTPCGPAGDGHIPSPPPNDGVGYSEPIIQTLPPSGSNDLPTAPPAPQPGDTYNFPASSSSTFTVSAGATTFTATQPNDSVATYVWEDGGGQPGEWLTSANGSTLDHALEFVPVANYAGVSPSTTITVNSGTTHQTIDGFGGAMTDSAASLILGSPNRNTIMDTLFGTDTNGGGLTIVRSPMGSSDMMADPNDLHTYEDTPGNFSVTAQPSDNRQIAALQQAKQLAGSNFKLLGTPWTAPGWMKNDGTLLPAQCGSDANEFNVFAHTQDYVNYFTNYINAYSSLGLTPWMVSMQNEPENCQTSMPTTQFSPFDEVTLGQAMKGKLPNGVKVLGWDHNWNDEHFVDTITSNNSVDAVGYHCYDGTNYNDQTQAVPTYFTECTGFTTGNANVATNLAWEVSNNIMGPLRYGSKGSIYWSLAQDPNGNPHYGGGAACKTCRGMITVNSDGSFVPSQDYYYWAQFSKFVAPGAVRVDSNNVGPLSTVAFHKGTTNVLVVLNSVQAQANGGNAGSDGRDLRGHMLQWNGDTHAQKTAWLVGADGHRRWIPDGSTFNCLKFDAGMQGPDDEASGALDKYLNLDNVWATCGSELMGTNSELEEKTYLKSAGGARLTLTGSSLGASDSAALNNWAIAGQGGTGNRLILRADGNLVWYNGEIPYNEVWSSNTSGSGAKYFVLRDEGSIALFDANNKEVWNRGLPNPAVYHGKIVQWDQDSAAQKSSWLVGFDGNRRWIPDLPTFQCLTAAGHGNSLSVTNDTLNKLPNLENVWATCGGTQIGPNGSLGFGANLTSGSYKLVLQTDGNLVEYNGTTPVWATNTSGSSSAELRLQTDGNLVLYDANGTAHWATNTQNSTPGWLILSNTGTLNLYNGSGALVWSNNVN